MKLKPIFKYIVMAKFFVLFLVFLSYSRVVQFGEKNLVGETATNTPEEAPKVAKNTKDKKNEQSSEKEGSILDDLLSLPVLDNKNSGTCEDLTQYLNLALKKEKQIVKKEKELLEREKRVKFLESSVDVRIKRFESEREIFQKDIQKEKEFKKERLDKLVTLYSKMEPKKAAPIFETMERDLVVALFQTLPDKQITKILEIMPPQRSKDITEYVSRIKSLKEYENLKSMNDSLKKERTAIPNSPKELAKEDQQPPQNQ